LARNTDKTSFSAFKKSAVECDNSRNVQTAWATNKPPLFKKFNGHQRYESSLPLSITLTGLKLGTNPNNAD
jgi:hypothetical protein